MASVIIDNVVLGGLTISIIDLYKNISNHTNINLSIQSKQNVLFLKDFFIKNINDISLLKYIKREEFIDDDIVIITFQTIFNSYISKKELNFKCKKLIIIDNWLVYVSHKLNLLKDIEIWLNKKFDDVIFLANPWLYQYITKSKKETYFIKLNKERLNHLKSLSENLEISYVRKYCIKHLNNELKDKKVLEYDQRVSNIPYNHDIYKCKDMYYCRWWEYKDWYKKYLNLSEIVTGNEKFEYVENIGKLIFEFCWLEKQVYYYNYNKELNDGLSYYLNLIGIDDKESQIITNKKKDIETYLFFNEKDLILDVLS